MKCILCGLKLLDDGIDPVSKRRCFVAAEGHGEGTLACENHPAEDLYAEEEQVAPHLPDTMPTVEEFAAAIEEGVEGYEDGVDEPLGLTPWQATTFRDLLIRVRAGELARRADLCIKVYGEHRPDAPAGSCYRTRYRSRWVSAESPEALREKVIAMMASRMPPAG